MSSSVSESQQVRPVGGLAPLLAALVELRSNCVVAEHEYGHWLRHVRPVHQASARNLVHYLAFRRHDLRPLQHALADRGLSSLGRCEANVLGTLDTVIDVVCRLCGEETSSPEHPVGSDGRDGGERLAHNATRLLGAPAPDREARIMVTLPSEAATQAGIVSDLVAAGMDVARINCAHDDADVWRTMARRVASASEAHGRPCRIAMDLAGPKLRTGPLPAGPRVVRVAPRRDDHGRVTAPARVLLHAPGHTPEREDVTFVPVGQQQWLAACRAGDVIGLVDARQASRRLTVMERSDDGVLVELHKTTYFETGGTLELRVDGVPRRATVGLLPERERAVLLHVGDELVLTRDGGRPADIDAPTPRFGCTLPEVLDHAAVDDRIWFDDGKIGGVVVARAEGELRVRVVDARPTGARLRGGKGINLPDTELPIAGLTDQDETDLRTAVEIADIVNMSFVRSADDVLQLQACLTAHGAGHVGIVLKIETVSGFEQLPEILLAAMRWERVGVMIARGDLAVEAGFERMAEVQEEILWLCESAHVPVVWATQVLDQLARTGRPSRAEITDAALSARAECIMLNKGPHILSAMSTLVDIHRRMGDHQHKKRTLLRRLRAWDHPSAGA